MDRLREWLFLLLLCFLSVGAELLNNEVLENTGVKSESVNVDQSPRFLTHLQTVLKEISSKLTEHQERIEQLQKENREQTLKIEQLQMENQGLKSRTNVTENQVDSLWRDREVGQVAFSAGLWGSGSNDFGPFDSHTTLLFRRVFSNIGSAYNPNTGKFTAPVRGVYHFDFYCYVGPISPGAAIRLEKNGALVVTAHENQSNGYGTAGNGVSLLLEAGEQVFLRLWKGYRIYDNSNHFNTFSGRLLFLM